MATNKRYALRQLSRALVVFLVPLGCAASKSASREIVPAGAHGVSRGDRHAEADRTHRDRLCALNGSVDAGFGALVNRFVRDYASLKIPELSRDYRENFRAISDVPEINRRLLIFQGYAANLKVVERSRLTAEGRAVYDQLVYEVEWNTKRLELERDYKVRYGNVAIPEDGLFRLPDHEKWHRLYLQRSASQETSPEQILKLGEDGVDGIKHEIRQIQKSLGFEKDEIGFYRHVNDASFFLTNESDVLAAFVEARQEAYAHLGNVVEDPNVSLVQVRAVPVPDKDTPPGNYDDGVFQFNFFGGKFNRRAIDWLFLHEAVPGHHYQIEKEKTRCASEFRNLYSYPGFVEGWGAYSENLGTEVGLYKDPYRYLGMLEWNLVRSARLVIDVGIHGQGWSKDQALAYWKKTIPNQDDIAVREIDRITRWPGQVVSYKAGEQTFLRLREDAKKQSRETFDLRKFHSLVLRHGSIPFVVLEKIATDGIATE